MDEKSMQRRLDRQKQAVDDAVDRQGNKKPEVRTPENPERGPTEPRHLPQQQVQDVRPPHPDPDDPVSP